MTQTARAETVGSLLRPSYLHQARRDAAAGRITAGKLRAIENQAVLSAIEMQEDVGLDVITDGEYRRGSWNAAIATGPDAPVAGYGMVEGYQPVWRRFWREASGTLLQRPLVPAVVVTSKLTPQRDIVEDEYEFLRQNTLRRTKYTFTAPSYHRVFWHPQHSHDAYPTVENYLEAVRDYIRREIVDKLIAMGCDYIQLDAPNYGQIYADPDVRAAHAADGHDPDADAAADAELDDSLFEGVSRVTCALHVCRGNGPGGIWSGSGGYEHFAHRMFPRLHNIDTLLLEYDSQRAGGFEPLQHVGPQTTVVLGLLTTKDGALEDAAAVEARIREASKYVPLQRLALSPQCGFSSAGEGNPLSFEQQHAKLDLVARVARRVWGKV